MAAKKKTVRKKPTRRQQPVPVDQVNEDDDHALAPEPDFEARKAAIDAAISEKAAQEAKQRQNGGARPGAGRPSLFKSVLLADLRAQLIEDLCGYIREGNFLGTACTRVGLSPRTVSMWLRKGTQEMDAGNWDGLHVEFTQAVRQAEADRQAMLMDCVVDAAKHRDWKTGDPKHWTAATWILERTDPATFGQKIRMHVEHELGAALERLQKALSADEYEKALAAIISDDGSPEAAPASSIEVEDGSEDDAAAVGAEDVTEVHGAETPEAPDRPD